MKPIAAFVIVAVLFGSTWLPESKAACGICHRDKCSTCQPCAAKCCHKEKVTYTEQRTRHKLVKECVPVCKVKYERRQDPCDPCRKTKVPVTYWENKTRYHWVTYCEPVCRTKTVKVCDTAVPAPTIIESPPPAQTEGPGELGMIQGRPIGPQETVIRQPAAVQEIPAAPTAQPAAPKYENEHMAIY